MDETWHVIQSEMDTSWMVGPFETREEAEQFVDDFLHLEGRMLIVELHNPGKIVEQYERFFAREDR